MTEKQINQIREMNLVHTLEPFLYPFFQEQHGIILQKIYNKHAMGEKDFAADVAQLSLLNEMLQRLEQIKQKGASASKIMHGE